MHLLLQLLAQKSCQQAKEQQKQTYENLDLQRSFSLVPNTFDIMRVIFGDKGPCVKPKKEVSVAHVHCLSACAWPQAAANLCSVLSAGLCMYAMLFDVCHIAAG